MKCGACGYRYEEWNGENLTSISDGDDEFIDINGHFTIDNTGCYGGEHSVRLLACPKCKTVKMYD